VAAFWHLLPYTVYTPRRPYAHIGSVILVQPVSAILSFSGPIKLRL